MKKKKMQLLAMAILLLLLVGAYFAIRQYNKGKEAKEEENAAQTTWLVEEAGEAVREFSYDLNGETYHFVRENDTWKCEERKDVPLRDALINLMVNNVAPLAMESKLDNVSNLDDYGLATPKQTIRLKTQNKEYVLKLGDGNSLTGSCYLMVEGDGTVYVVSSIMESACTYALDDLIQKETEESSAK